MFLLYQHLGISQYLLLPFCVLLRFFVKGAQNMYEVFEKLLQKFGVTTYQVSKATGISQSTFSNWKQRRNLISGDKAKIIADYFGVTVDYLMKGEDTETKYYLNEETAKVAQEIFENKELRVLFDAARDANPEDLRTTYDMLMALKRKEQNTDDDTGC